MRKNLGTFALRMTFQENHVKQIGALYFGLTKCKYASSRTCFRWQERIQDSPKWAPTYDFAKFLPPQKIHEIEKNLVPEPGPSIADQKWVGQLFTVNDQSAVHANCQL